MRRAALLLFALLPSPGEPAKLDVAAGVKPIEIADPTTYWAESGFVEMTPPIRLPSKNGDERISVWLRLPNDGRVRVAPGRAGRSTLKLPAGAVADRVDTRDWRRPASVQDVRGTRFDDGEEYFHVLRPLRSPGLSGLEWRRGDDDASRAATAAMRAAIAESDLRNRDPDEARLDQFARLNDCASCHVHDRPERTRGDDERRPNRGTDADGLYTIASVLSDSAPLETHRALDTNEGDPYVRVTCQGGTDAVMKARGRERHFICPDASIPRGTLDTKRALREGDPRARAVCASRRYLAAHMDADARAVFADALATCGE